MTYKPLGLRGRIANSLNEYAIAHQDLKDVVLFLNSWGRDVAQREGFDLSDPEILAFTIVLADDLLKSQTIEQMKWNRDIEEHMERITASYHA